MKILRFDSFNENSDHAALYTQKSEDYAIKNSQKIVYSPNSYTIGERVIISIYIDHNYAGRVGLIAEPTSKLKEDQVLVEFKDGKKYPFYTNEIDRF